MSRWLLIAALCTGCGRFGFGAEVDAAAAGDSGDGGGSAMAHDGGDMASCAGFDVCDQFEDAALAPVWAIHGNVSHSNVAHRGTGSLHFGVPAIGANTMGGALISETQTFGAGASPFWVRVWVRFSAHAAAQNHLELLSADQSTDGGLADYVFAEADATTLYSQFDEMTAPLPVPIPLDTWTCLIWHVAPNDGAMTLTGDLGSSSYSGVLNGTPPLSVIEIGPNLSSTNVAVDQPALDVWADDVIIHHAPVTCAD